MLSSLLSLWEMNRENICGNGSSQLLGFYTVFKILGAERDEKVLQFINQLLMCLFNPRLTKLFFVTRLTKGGLLQPPP